MNLRQHKKACKKAVIILVGKYGFHAKDFTAACGDETLYARDIDKRITQWRFKDRIIDSGYFSPMKGTPLHWKRTSYEYDEWDCETPLSILAEIEWVNSIDWQKYAQRDWYRFTFNEHARKRFSS